MRYLMTVLMFLIPTGVQADPYYGFGSPQGLLFARQQLAHIQEQQRQLDAMQAELDRQQQLREQEERSRSFWPQTRESNTGGLDVFLPRTSISWNYTPYVAPKPVIIENPFCK